MPLATHQVLTEVHLSPRGTRTTPTGTAPSGGETDREPHDGFDFVWWERAADPQASVASGSGTASAALPKSAT